MTRAPRRRGLPLIHAGAGVMVVVLASLATSVAAAPPGYWERCGDAAAATQVMHHDEDCRKAKRIAEAYSRDNPDPEGWRCEGRGRGITSIVHSSPETVVTCVKKPGTAVRVIRFKLSACPGTGRSSAGGATRRSDDWPGIAGHTTILASKDSKAAARRAQNAACDRGLAAGVLYSTNYRSLKRGFWVVFSGTSAGRQEAQRRTKQAKSLGYRGAYTRFVR